MDDGARVRWSGGTEATVSWGWLADRRKLSGRSEDVMTELIGRHAAAWFGAALMKLVLATAAAAPELAALWVAGCGLLMMLTGDVGRWAGRAGVGIMAGMILRLVQL